MKQSVLEYKKLLEQEGLLVEFAEPEGKEGEDRPVTLVTYFRAEQIRERCFSAKELHSKRHT